MGIAEAIQSRAARPGSAAQTMERVLQGDGNEIGFGLISEVKPYESKGIRLVGPLPAAVQSYISYEAILSSTTKKPAEAAAFIRFITAAAAKQTFAGTGVD